MRVRFYELRRGGVSVPYPSRSAARTAYRRCRDSGESVELWSLVWEGRAAELACAMRGDDLDGKVARELLMSYDASTGVESIARRRKAGGA